MICGKICSVVINKLTKQSKKRIRQNHKKNSNNKKNDIEKPTKRDDRNTNAVQQNKFSLSKEAWAALSQEQRDMWKNLQRSHKEANKTIKETDKRKSHLSQSNSTDSEDTLFFGEAPEKHDSLSPRTRRLDHPKR